MTSILKVDTIQDQSGNNIINENADTITIGASGDTIDVPGTEVKTNKVSPTSGTTLTLGDSGDTITIPSGATITNSGTATGFGKVLQVVSTTKTDTFSVSTTGSWVDITDLSLTITPSSTLSKIFISFSVQEGSSNADYAHLRLDRNGTAVGIGDADGSRIQATTNFRFDLTASQLCWSNEFLDSPSSISALTYKLQIYNVGAGTRYVNRTSLDTNNTNFSRAISTITAMEIAG